MTDDNSKADYNLNNLKNRPAPKDTGDDGGGDDDDGGLEFPVSMRTVAIALSALFAVLLSVTVLLVAPYRWQIAIVATAVGVLPGLTLFPWLASPFGPGLWMLSQPFARIHLTISQAIRRVGVLVKRSSNNYEIGVYVDDEEEVVLSDDRVRIDENHASWGLFGKRKFGVMACDDTDLYQSVRAKSSDGAAVADGGDDAHTVNMAAVHRYFEGANNSDVISRTEEKAEAEFGGGTEELSGTAMGVLVGVMLMLGSFTAMMML